MTKKCSWLSKFFNRILVEPNHRIYLKIDNASFIKSRLILQLCHLSFIVCSNINIVDESSNIL